MLTLTPEQQNHQQRAYQFASDIIRPIAAHYDQTETVPWELVHQAAQAGFLSHSIPVAYGGSGLSLLTQLLINEEIGWGCAGVGTLLGGSGLCATPIILAGTTEQKARFLPRFCDPNQPRLGAFALTEPTGGSDPSAMTTYAQREGGCYRLNGAKTFITNAGIADLYVIFATVNRRQPYRGITAFVVEADTPGLITHAKEHKMGIRASHTAALTFDNLIISVNNRLGEEGAGLQMLQETLQTSRLGTTSMAIGLARAAYEYALDYAHRQLESGQPLIQHQATAFMLADMATQIEAARLLLWRAAHLIKQGHPSQQVVSMAKLYGGETAMQVTSNALQILGHAGYLRQTHPVEKWFRDAKIMQIYEGTSEIQRLIIARNARPQARTTNK